MNIDIALHEHLATHSGRKDTQLYSNDINVKLLTALLPGNTFDNMEWPQSRRQPVSLPFTLAQPPKTGEEGAFFDSPASAEKSTRTADLAASTFDGASMLKAFTSGYTRLLRI